MLRARLRDGRDVAVKVQYPLIDEIVKALQGNPLAIASLTTRPHVSVASLGRTKQSAAT